MEVLVKLAALCLCASAVTALLRRSDEALALLLLLASILAGCALLLPVLSELADFCARTLSLTPLPEVLFVPLLKVTAIALIVRFSCASWRIVFRTSPTSSGSSADVGSSNKITSGRIASARAIATRCC